MPELTLPDLDRLGVEAQAELAALRQDRLLLARLSADEPQFFNPLEAMAAKVLRDRILEAARKETL